MILNDFTAIVNSSPVTQQRSSQIKRESKMYGLFIIIILHG